MAFWARSKQLHVGFEETRCPFAGSLAIRVIIQVDPPPSNSDYN